MSDTEDEYTSRVAKEVESWVESLVAKGTRTFKLTECKDKFMKEPISVLSTACDGMIAAKKLSIDPSSRRIMAYIIEEAFFRDICERIAQDRAEKAEVVPKKVRKIEEVTSSGAKEEEKRAKPATAAPAAKKQKVEAPLGVKKISSYFQVQATPRPPQATKEASSLDETDPIDENVAPPVKNSSASNLAALPRPTLAASASAPPHKPSAQGTSSRVDTALAPRTFQIVDILPATPVVCGSSSSNSAGGNPGTGVSQEIVDMVTRLLSAAFARHSGTVAIDALVQDCLAGHQSEGEGRMDALALDAAGVQQALRQLEGRNAIMVDEGVIYEV